MGPEGPELNSDGHCQQSTYEKQPVSDAPSSAFCGAVSAETPRKTTSDNPGDDRLTALLAELARLSPEDRARLADWLTGGATGDRREVAP